jgi:GTP-binding protein Era
MAGYIRRYNHGMATFDDILRRFPPDVQTTVRTVWEALGQDEQADLLKLLTNLPTESDLIRLLTRLSTAQIRQTFGQKKQVAIVGPTNVGKSTFYNQLVSEKKDQAEVGLFPGTTTENQRADAALFVVVDTPGADAVGELGEREKDLALSAAENADFLVILFDAIQGIKKNEQELFREFSALKKPYVVILNKIDLVPRRDLEKVVALAAENLGLKPEQVIPVAAKDGKNFNQVLLAIAAAEPKIVAALGQALPAYRWQLAWRSIVSAASISGVIALAPLPVVDFIPLIATQSLMVLGIARIYNYRITPKRAKELVMAFGLGFLGRTLFQELSKLGGVPGWLLSAAIASSTTVVMGYAAVRWFENGERVSSEVIGRLTREITLKQVDALKRLGQRKPSEKGLQEILVKSLEDTGMGDNPPSLEEKAPDTLPAGTHEQNQD